MHVPWSGLGVYEELLTHDRIGRQSIPVLLMVAASWKPGKHPLTIERINKYWYSIHPVEYYTALNCEKETIGRVLAWNALKLWDQSLASPKKT